MNENQNKEALLKMLEEQKIVVAYCCCGTKRTASTSC